MKTQYAAIQLGKYHDATLSFAIKVDELAEIVDRISCRNGTIHSGIHVPLEVINQPIRIAASRAQELCGSRYGMIPD